MQLVGNFAAGFPFSSTPKDLALAFAERIGAAVPGFEGKVWIDDAEAALHPAEAPAAELYLMTDDLAADMRSLSERGVELSDVEEARWGTITKIRLPSGGEIGLYQPKHPTAIEPPPG